MLSAVPAYEQPIDLAREDAVADALSLHWSWEQVIKLPPMHAFDRAIVRAGRIVGFVEIKCRPGLSFGYGDGYYVAANKVVTANDMRAALDVSTVLAVYFPDEPDLVRYTLLRGPYRPIWAGRRDRPHDPCAMEAHAVIPWSDFRAVRVTITIPTHDGE